MAPGLPIPKLPLAASLPAAAAGLAYVNAKYGVTNDVWTIWSAITFQIYLGKLEKADRVNTFYRFEEYAKDPKTANRPFLIVPKTDSDPNGRTEWTYAEAYDTVLKYAGWLSTLR